MSDLQGQLQSSIGHAYTFERELGAGGMATVYLARDRKHDRDVAIKVLHPDLGAALGGERFLSEIKTTAKLQHSHILPLLDSGEADGLLYYVMPGVTPGSGANTSNFTFDVAPDGRIILAEEIRGSFDLVLVRNGLTRLGQGAGK